MQVNIFCSRASGWYGQASYTYAVGSSIINVGPYSATMGLAIDTTEPGVGFLHGAVISGVVNSGITIARNTVTPDTGLWVSAATTYGIYIGAKALYPLNSGQNPTFDSSHNPAIGIALGETAATSGSSNILRFTSTSAGGSENNIDISTDNVGDIVIKFNGTTSFTLSANGSYSVSGVQLLANSRQNVTGAKGGNTALASLLTALATHGLITHSTTS